MIVAVKANQTSFKDVFFRQGLNIVLADRTKESDQKDTRNGLGKSTIIEIIHFCFGGDASATLKDEHLQNWTFTVDLMLAGKPVSVSRNTESSRKVSIEADIADWPLKPKLNNKNGELEFTISQWNALLGTLMFGLPMGEDMIGQQPTFRGLISYFIRRGPDAYSTPFEHHRKMKEAEIQIFNAFLLGLDWRYASEWQQSKDREKLLADLKRAAKVGIIKGVLDGTLGDLEAKRVQSELAVQKSRGQLDSFQVHPQYEEVEKRASALTREIHDLENQNFADTQLLEAYKRSIAEETPPSSDDLLRVYEEASVIFPETVKKRFEDVQEFHRKLIENRRSFLESEIDRLAKTIEARRAQVIPKSNEKAALMGILKTHGALEEHSRLEQLHLETVAQLKDVERRIDNLKRFETGKTESTIEKQLLLKRARIDLDQRHEKIRKAITLFNENSQALYQSPGTLAIDVQPTGYKFHIEIERSKSEGIGNMKVFCYDLMLAQLWSEQSHNPGLLIHDSSIFDGVDERQRALALVLARKEAEARGFQYICMLNSDMIPVGDLPPGFDIDEFVRLRLTDATDGGGLLGTRF